MRAQQQQQQQQQQLCWVEQLLIHRGPYSTVQYMSVLAAGEFMLFDIVCKQRIIVPITELLAVHFKHQGSDLCMYTAMDCLSAGIAAKARHALAVLLTAAVLFNTAAHSGVNAARARAFGMSACVDEHVAATPCQIRWFAACLSALETSPAAVIVQCLTVAALDGCQLLSEDVIKSLASPGFLRRAGGELPP